MSRSLRLISYADQDGQASFDQVWHVASHADAAQLSKTILAAIGNADAGKTIFWSAYSSGETGICTVYLEDVVRILKANKCTAWLPAPSNSHAAAIVFQAVVGTESSEDAEQAAADKDLLHSSVHEIAKIMLQRCSEESHAFLPFWDQQVWCRHLTIRLIAAKTGKQVHLIWPLLQR